jgi:DNA polymerase I-like protein with 3'-5' exonuclease and polymerase domains/uracil-DNA glycosylase
VRKLPLYVDRMLPQAAVELAAPREVDPKCEGCSAAANVPSHLDRCVPADAQRLASEEAESDTLLVLVDGVTREDAAARRVLSSSLGRVVRRMVEQRWKGSVVYDAVSRCPAPKGQPTTDMVSACRPYLAQTLLELRGRVSRILCFGSESYFAVLGRSPPAFSVRHGHGFLGDGTPVFILLPPWVTVRNRFARQWLEEDLAWALEAKPRLPPYREGDVVDVTEPADVRSAFQHAARVAWTSVDCEWAGEVFEDDFRLLSVSLTPRGSRVGYVWGPEALGDPALRDPLVGWLADPAVPKLGQNFKSDSLALRWSIGANVDGVVADTKLWRKLFFGDAAASLEVMQELVGVGGGKEEKQLWFAAIARAIKGKKPHSSLPHVTIDELDPAIVAQIRLAGADKKKTFQRYAHALLPREVLIRYNARDTVSTAVLGEHMEREFATEPELRNVWDRMVRPANRAITQMEWWGVRADVPAMRTFHTYLDDRLKEARQAIAAIGINPNAPKQVGRHLYETLGLPVPYYASPGNPSTDREALEQLKDRDRSGFVGHMLTHRKFTKPDGAIVGMERFVRVDGRLHPSYNIDGARSGRLSCSEPNLFNIPSPERDPVLGKMARDLFVAPRGKLLIEADYSQLEIRIAAMLSGDVEMLRLLRSGEDFHLATAKLISKLAWNVEPENVTSRHRRSAKTINFGLLYGQGAKQLAIKAGISVDDAIKVKTAILGRFKQLDAWIKAQLAYTRKTGIVWTWWAGEAFRRRSLWQAGSSDDGARGNAERSSWNTPIQGTGADFCLASLIDVVDWILEDTPPAKLVLSVYDSLLLEVDEDAVDEVAWQVNRRMTQWDSLGVPIVVDFKVGERWGSMEKIKVAA